MSAPHFIEPRPTGVTTTLRILQLVRAALALAQRPASLTARLERYTDKLHADGDAFAKAEGWQITRTRGGGRTYRHPGFVREVDQ